MGNLLTKTFAALEVRNFKLFISGQGISLCGTWMQTIGLSWLVLQMTHSGTQLGLVVAAQFVPIMVLGVWGGVIADRFDKRTTLYFTQSAFGLLALTLGLLVVSHSESLWMVYVLAVMFGLVNVADTPTRQSFVIEMAGEKHLKNAITLNSTMVNMARLIGPTIAGIIIATLGVGACFLINALSYIAVIIALKLMRESELMRAPKVKRMPRQIRDGLTYVWHVPRLKTTILMMFIIGTFAYEFPVIFPLFATLTLHGNAGTYAEMMAALGVGSVFGGLYTAGQAVVKDQHLIYSALAFGGLIVLASLMPSKLSVLIILILVGALSVVFVALGNTLLQLTSRSDMRGRVMSLWAIAFAGTTPIGGPLIGYISDHSNPRVGLAIGGVSAIVASGLGLYLFHRSNGNNLELEANK